MHYYSDDLTEMLLDDILADTVKEMNKVEGQMRTKEVVDESKGMAANILKHIVDYQSEEHLVQTRWAGDKAKNIVRPADQQKIDVSENYYDVQPKAIKFDQGQGEIGEISMDKYQNPFEPGLSLNAQIILEESKNNQEKRSDRQEKEGMQLTGLGMPSDTLPHNSQERLYSVQGTLPGSQMHKLQLYREKYDSYLKMHNNTSTKEVWKIYDHIAAELMKEKLNEVLDQYIAKDLDRYVEQVITDEF